jgi:hypothetical protein
MVHDWELVRHADQRQSHKIKVAKWEVGYQFGLDGSDGKAVQEESDSLVMLLCDIDKDDDNPMSMDPTPPMLSPNLINVISGYANASLVDSASVPLLASSMHNLLDELPSSCSQFMDFTHHMPQRNNSKCFEKQHHH